MHATVKTSISTNMYNKHMRKRSLPKIQICILLDVIGCVSYIFPPFGPIWAALSGLIFFFMFGRRFGVFGGIFSFLEELIPGVDFIPTFTIAWFMRKREIEKEASEKRLKIFR